MLTWLIPLLDSFPRNRRFTLGERLESGLLELLELLELLVEAAYSRNKIDLLKRANLRISVIRHLWRMAHELKTIPTKRYAHGAELLEDLGRQIGGWLKSVAKP
ncbi:MAG: diversity-generating retroelement protein Avd [Gammaproteobacteria bacterium]|nr:diversity-generating retroelement protein Avd [Gammaproteobacteria bacterium]